MESIPAGFVLGDVADAVGARLDALKSSRFAERLWQRDPTLWGADAESVARRRLGWLLSPDTMLEVANELVEFARDARADGYRHAVLLGMGGSSLAPEVLERTLGATPGIALTVLDSTSPAAVREVSANADPSDTLFLVCSKSGATIEVTSLERHFWARAYAAHGDAAGRGFVAITDPDTPLVRLAAERGYRRVFVNDSNIGGRYSALSCFGLVPAALLGIDLHALLEHARLEKLASQRIDSETGAPHGYVLGAALGELARRGRDKLTLLPGPELGALGDWVEQLVAESTGKRGVGIVPVVGERVGRPEDYGSDRVFVTFSAAPPAAELGAALTALANAGHPVLRWRHESATALGAEFLRWEIATATAAAILEVNPFDEPNVSEAKAATLAALGRNQGPSPPASGAVDPGGARVLELLARARPGDYFAILAFLHRTTEIDDRLQSLRHQLGRAARLATTLGYGPRYLHSTGQLHKGGADNGIFLLLTADEGDDVPIPGESFGFRGLIDAQATGDREVLSRHGRRVVHLHLGARPVETLDRLAQALSTRV